MSDEPKTIYAEQTGYFMRDGIYHNGGRWNDDEKSGLVEYCRADLPPTLSAAMELPEVKDVLTLLTEARADLIRLRAEVATLRASEARMREALTIAETTIADLERANASYQSALSERGIDGSKGTEE